MSDRFDMNCPARRLLDRLGDKWTMVAVSALSTGPKRSGELRRALRGVSQKVLTELLRSLERDGLLSRHVLAPFRVEYRLTPLGVSLSALLEQIRDWAETHFNEAGTRSATYDASTYDASKS
jgi:DNA-binding HxlR family transcriptional regulator